MSVLAPQAEIPEKLGFLAEPARYKVLYGGRGGSKSWGVARVLLMKGATTPIRVLCCREFQNSIADSVHRLLSDQIYALGLEAVYEIQKNKILGKNGTEFGFEGLRHNITSIKSYEGADIAWVEEAQTVSNASWDILIPTIRKPGSEIWVTFNPQMKEDATYQRFVVKPPATAKVVKIDWRDNPWFPDVLRQEMDDLRERDHDKWLNVWEGHCVEILEGAIYANELRAATAEGRITRVPYNPQVPVHTFWDLGRSDKTAIWFAQAYGFEYRFIDYYENSGVSLQHYLKVLQERGYVYGDVWLPHDATHELLGSERTVEQQVRKAGFRVRISPRASVSDGISAARTIFPLSWFDEEKCADGLQCLRNYRYELDEDLKVFKKTPLHDWASHGADAFRYAGVSLREPKKRTNPNPYADEWGGPRHSGDWMG